MALSLRKVLFFRVLIEQKKDPEASHKVMSPTSKEPTSSHHIRKDCINKRRG